MGKNPENPKPAVFLVTGAKAKACESAADMNTRVKGFSIDLWAIEFICYISTPSFKDNILEALTNFENDREFAVELSCSSSRNKHISVPLRTHTSASSEAKLKCGIRDIAFWESRWVLLNQTHARFCHYVARAAHKH